MTYNKKISKTLRKHTIILIVLIISPLVFFTVSALNSVKENNIENKEDPNNFINQLLEDIDYKNQFGTYGYYNIEITIYSRTGELLNILEEYKSQLYGYFGTSSLKNESLDFQILGLSLFLLLSSITSVLISKKGIKKSNSENIGESGLDKKIDINNFHEIEEIIIDLIQEYLEMNKCFNKERIIPFLIGRISKMDTNLNTNGIKTVVESLEEKKVVIQGSKLIKQNVLNNSNRYMIYRFVNENPGTYLNQIITGLNLNIFIIKWHLDILIRFNFIREKLINNQKVYYDSKLNSKFEEFYYLISNRKCIKIIKYLKSNDQGNTIYEISKTLGMHFNTVKKYLNELDKNNLLLSKKFSNKTLYFLNGFLFDQLNI